MCLSISARGGIHSYQGLATMDCYVVIDIGRTCKPDEIVVDKTNRGSHTLQGNKNIGTIMAQARCTNIIMMAAGNEHFGEVAGGAGDISPCVGYGVDVVKGFELILYYGGQL